MTTTSYKNDDTVPLQATLPTDLSDASSVEFRMSDTKGGSAIVSGSALIDDAAAGIVKYQWQAGETDRTGTFYMEWEVTYSDGGVETFPRRGFDVIRFYEEIE